MQCTGIEPAKVYFSGNTDIHPEITALGKLHYNDLALEVMFKQGFDILYMIGINRTGKLHRLGSVSGIVLQP